MKKREKYLELLRNSSKNIRFKDLLNIVDEFGFYMTGSPKGSHHVFLHDLVDDAILNLQPDKNGKAKSYQVRQLLKLIDEYKL